jgi:hypothetical protein
VLVTPQKHRSGVPTLQEAEASGNAWEVDVDQQLLIESAGGDSVLLFFGSFVLIYLSQALNITPVTRFLDR